MAGLVIFVLIGGGIALAIAYAQEQNKQRGIAWEGAARDLGLIYVAGTGWAPRPVIQGQLRGVAVRVEVVTKGSGDSQSNFTRYTLNYPGVAATAITLRKQTPFSVFGRLIGRRDVEIGDPIFDDRVVIDAPDAVAAAQYLTPARRMAVLTMFEHWKHVEVTANSIIVEYQGIERSHSQLVGIITRLLDMSLVLSAPSTVDLALEQQARGDLADAVDALHEINDVQDAPPNSFTQLLEAEALVAMGEGAKAEEVLDAMEVSDPEIDRWRDLAHSHPTPAPIPEPTPAPPLAVSDPAPVPAAAPDPAPEPAAPQPAIVHAPLDQDSVITDLFDSNRLGHEVEARFFEAYEGATVEWTGTLERSREFRSDSDFPGAGVKATVRIGSKGDGRLVSDQIHAIVHLPEGAPVERDQSVRFRGSFVRVDRYMRNMFVANAVVIS